MLARRAILKSGIAVLSGGGSASARPPQPPVGTCAECIGLTSTPEGASLAQCRLDESSCVSSFSDDDYSHFLSPWELDDSITRIDAIDKLVSVATSQVPYRVTRPAGSLIALLPLASDHYVTFSGQLDALDYEGYVRVAFGDGERSPVYDAEFFFPKEDRIVLLRCAARPGGRADTPRVQLSFFSGFDVNRNGAFELMEDLRKALRWQSVPVLTSWDPKYSSEVKLPFEQLFERALPRAVLR
jgi:uncharacterized protein (DUF1499 family)